jgi:olfactory receptor
MIDHMDWNNAAKQQCVCVYIAGLTQNAQSQKIVFSIFSIFTWETVSNMFIIVTIKYSQTLRSPKYFSLFFVLFWYLLFNIYSPRLNALSVQKMIFYNECMTQVFPLHLFGSLDIFVLVLLAVDCYVAICKPLHYTATMSLQVCHILIVLDWIGSFIHGTTKVILLLKLPFCGPNLIDHYYCDLQPLLKLAFMDMYLVNLFMSNSGAICWRSFVILIISYTVILHSVCNHSAEGKRKALSTCTSHIIVVNLSFVSCIFMYARPPTTFPYTRWWQYFIPLENHFLIHSFIH